MTLLCSPPMPPRSVSVRCPHPHRPRRQRVGALLVAVHAFLAAAGCQGVIGLDPEVVREQVTAALEAYYPKLAAAYAEQDTSHLADVAVRKEMSHVELRIDEMAVRGERIVSALRQFTVDTVRVARGTAYVATTEVWDIELRTSGSDRLLNSYPGQRYRVRYQMKLDGGVWRVVFRSLTETPLS